MNFRMTLVSLLSLLCCSCSRQEPVSVTWEQLIHQLYSLESIADISQSCTEIRTSYDRSGGNNDYSNGYKNLGNGWLELADFKGPGVLTRLWFTGIKRETRFRFIFDDEIDPRLETTCDAFFEGESGFPETFNSGDQYCFHTGFPVPYQKRLRILVSDEGYSQGEGKLYFQINATRLENRIVQSAIFPVPQMVQDAAEAVFDSVVPQGTVISNLFSISGDTEQEVLALQSGGVVRKLRIELDGWGGMTFHQRRSLLRQLWLHIAWDGSGVDSVRVPLGDFFGQMWEPKKLSNLYLIVDDTGFECRFPMPVKKSASVVLHNYGKPAVSGSVMVVYDPQPAPDGAGYLHCAWLQTSEQYQGTPHAVLEVEGKGRLAGCLLGAASMDRSFWVLESDETISRDGAQEVFWQGTGLEDYFNGGWYYRTVFQNPLFGLTMKRPFRTVQYRFHLADAVTFSKELDMSFERGPGNKSRAVFASTAWYYLDRPVAAPSPRIQQAWVTPPRDEFEARSLMTRLWDYEKFDDWTNAEKLTAHALQYWRYPPEVHALFEVRLLAYQAELNGYETVREQFHKLSVSGDAGAKNLIRYYEQDAVLFFTYSNKKTVVYLDGTRLLETSDPTRSQVAAIDLAPGRHVLAVETEVGKWPDWVQAGFKQAGQVMGLDSSWTCSQNPTGNWKELVYDDADWQLSISLCKGPPEQESVPFVYPDAYPGLQSAVNGVRARKIVDGGKVVFRKVFETR